MDDSDGVDNNVQFLTYCRMRCARGKVGGLTRAAIHTYVNYIQLFYRRM